MRPAASILPQLCFRVGQRVIERFGEGKQFETCESECVARDGDVITTETGNTYDVLSGMAIPRGKVYRSIREMTEHDRERPAEEAI